MSDQRAQFDRLLGSVLNQLELRLGSGQISTLHQHYTLLNHWNKRMNLTAIKTVEEVVFRHFGESLAVARVLGPGVGGVVDIGAGAGFPGGPVAVAFPTRYVTLVESSEKKSIFLREIARMLPNVAVFDRRFEEFEGRSEWAVMRGVAPRALAAHLNDVTERVAAVVSAARAPQAAQELGLRAAEERQIPWDARTVVLVGDTSAGSST